MILCIYEDFGCKSLKCSGLCRLILMTHLGKVLKLQLSSTKMPCVIKEAILSVSYKKQL